MNTLQIVLGVIYVLICIGLVITVMFQESSSKGLGVLAGEKTEIGRASCRERV